MPHKKAEFNGKKILMCSDQILEMGANVGFEKSLDQAIKSVLNKDVADSIFNGPVVSKLADYNPMMDEDPGPDSPGPLIPPPDLKWQTPPDDVKTASLMEWKDGGTKDTKIITGVTIDCENSTGNPLQFSLDFLDNNGGMHHGAMKMLVPEGRHVHTFPIPSFAAQLVKIAPAYLMENPQFKLYDVSYNHRKPKLGDGVAASEAAQEFKQSGKISQKPIKISPLSVIGSTAYYVGASKSYPWNASGPAYPYPKPMPPPKKPDPEPMDLTSKRRINLSE